MDATAIPMTHITMWLEIFGILVTVILAAAGGAAIGVRLALKPIKIETALNKEAVRSELDSIKKARDERGATVLALQDAVQRRVLIVDCLGNQALCAKYRMTQTEGLGKQVETLNASLAAQDEKRQLAVKENNAMVTDIRLEIGHLTDVAKGLTEHFDLLKKLIINRQNNFRSPEPKDLMS